MPLFYTNNIDDTCKFGIWRIEEPEEFFATGISAHHEVKHPSKRIQHVAGRYLLTQLDPAFPVDEIRIDGKRPYLDGNRYFFSISHCRDFVAAIMSRDVPVGIDVELVRNKVEAVETKFLSTKEIELIDAAGDGLSPLQKLTSAWCAKECMFKWNGKGRLSLKNDIELRKIMPDNEYRIHGFLTKRREQDLMIRFRFFDDLCLAWLHQAVVR